MYGVCVCGVCVYVWCVCVVCVVCVCVCVVCVVLCMCGVCACVRVVCVCVVCVWNIYMCSFLQQKSAKYPNVLSQSLQHSDNYTHHSTDSILYQHNLLFDGSQNKDTYFYRQHESTGICNGDGVFCEVRTGFLVNI
jgi:cytochrome bd-type quinol oxidase subunit 2